MQNLRCYQQLPVWNFASIPEHFKQAHNTKVGTWAKLDILHGHLDFVVLNDHGDPLERYSCNVNNQPPYISPQVWHKIDSASTDVQCQLSFYCDVEDYFSKKHQLSPTHSEILMAMPHLQLGKALDVGCGHGRNTLYLNQHGFQVDAFDVNPQSIQKLNDIIQIEKLENIHTTVRDLNQDQNLEGQYDFVFSTVVMMFLQAKTIPPLIQNMQNATKAQGFNLIVCAMDTEDYPAQPDFPFTFKPNQLRDYYHDWNILKYNENVGELHRTDAHGNRIKQRFATLLAKKI